MNTATESLFWYWVNERHLIYTRRQQGQPRPWTADPILQSYKFTNVFRELDRGTIWLREHFLEPHRNDPPELIAFNICWYRMFNWTGTAALLGWQTGWNCRTVTRRLRPATKVFTGAYLIHSDPGISKVSSIVSVCRDLWWRRRDVASVAQETKQLRTVWRELQKVPHIGPFMAYEMVTDMRHTRLLSDATDIMTWANAGPGALRGLRRMDPDVRPRETVERMQDLLARSSQNLASWVPPLEMRDVEHSLCEFDKYCRVKFGEGRPRSTYPGRV